MAIKEIYIRNLRPHEALEYFEEVNVLKDTNHENVLKYIGYEYDENFLYIITEYCEVKQKKNT